MKNLILIFLIGTLLFPGCKKEEMRLKDESYKPDIRIENFNNPTLITNPYYPLETGKTYVFEGMTEEGMERIEVKLKSGTKNIMGITCAIQNDKVWLNGVLIEDTDDWIAQDNDGTVWYFGETVKNYNSRGEFVDSGGSWEAGVDGAQPGLWMPAQPILGMKYRQEYYFNEAEDEAEIIEVGLTVTTRYGTFTDCIVTHDFTDLDKEVKEYKTYAPGIGLIKEENITDNEIIELVEIK